jgi:hypothetical protein
MYNEAVTLTKSSKLLYKNKNICGTGQILSLSFKMLIIEKGAVFRNFLEAIYKDMLFIDILGDGCLVPTLHFWKTNVGKFEKSKNIKSLNIEKIACLETQLGNEDDLQFYNIFDGIGDDENRFGLDFTIVNEIDHLPIVIQNKYNFTHVQYDNKYKIISSNIIAKDVHCNFTLKEVISAIFYELSFFGTPEKVIKTRNEMQKRVRDIKSGKIKLAKLSSLEDLIKSAKSKGKSQ